MGDDTKRLFSGDRWHPVAGVLNAYQEAADYVRELKTGGGALPESAPASNACVISVKNTSGDDRNRFDVLGIDEPIFSPDDNLQAFKSRDAICAVEPSPQKHRGRWVVLLRPITDGAIGPAVAAGVVKTRVYVNSPDDKYCELIESKTWCDETVYLGTGPSGTQILWLEKKDCDITGTIVWAIIRLGGTGEVTTTSTTTTTTTDPGIGGCHGTCRWTWSAGNRVWSLNNDGCNTTTTTSTTTTSPDPNTTTTTTLPPCECAKPTSTTSSTTTTPGPTTTTTTPAPCKCLYPTFCGEVEGECTVTYCAPPQYDSQPPDCTTTTTGDPNTTTTTGPTTTTADPCPECSDCCKGVCQIQPDGSTKWVYANKCPEKCSDCEHNKPTGPCSPCNGASWAGWGGGGGGDGGGGGGGGGYWTGACCIDSGGSIYGCWLPSSNPPPSGPPPSRPPNFPGETIPDTPTPPIPPDGPTTTIDPCRNKQTTTTVDPKTSTTTSTPNPCQQRCKWQWSEGAGRWTISKNPCGPNCPCCPPGFDGAAGCEVALTPCQSAPCPTTTTKPPCSGCGYVCTNHQWVLSYNLCKGDCSCHAPPSGPCVLNGSKAAFPCIK